MWRHRKNEQAATKMRRVLHLICAVFLLLAFRAWHLGIAQREEGLKDAQKPKTRTVLLRADRGEICDRFHIPMAVNRICYNAAVYYGQINQIPTRGWQIDEKGARVRTFPRKEHIQNLSKVLGRVLDLDPGRIEDLIHAKASLLPHVPFVLKTHLKEEEYYRLKMLEREWLGIHAEIGQERYYPLHKTGCHIIGSLGSISQKKYTEVVQEIHNLQEIIHDYEMQGALPDEYISIDFAYKRLEELKDKAYTINDLVGKSGIEARFEADLRGVFGVKTVEVDQLGKTLKELPGGKTPIPGRRTVLSISSELQQFAEELLTQNEKDREGRSVGLDPSDKVRKIQKQPWIKGGAIVAMDPRNGEILAFASHPRFDPNDFVGKGRSSQISRWLETERMIASLWDGQEVLVRERPLREERSSVSWEFYLDQILPKEGPMREVFEKADDVAKFVQIQEEFQEVLYFSKAASPLAAMEELPSKQCSRLQSIATPADRLFVIDLCHLVIDSPRFSDELLAKIGSMKIGTYRLLNQAFCRLEKKRKEEALHKFHAAEFAAWRARHQKAFLQQKREEEKEKKTYARPYIDYLDQKEKELFQVVWEEKKIPALLEYLGTDNLDSDRELLQKTVASLPPGLGEEFLRTFRTFQELERSLLTPHRRFKTEKDLASAFYPQGGFGYSRSYAFQTSAPQGSVLKLVTAYEGLRQGVQLSIIDEHGQDGKNQIVAYSLNKNPYPRIYKGGRLPRTHAAHVGKIDLVGALAHSSNPYFSILAGDYFKNPEDLNTAASLFGYGKKSGIDLPGEVAGNLPKDLKMNKTGLYSYAIGQHTLLTTPLRSTLMLASLANGGHLLRPSILKRAASHPPEYHHSLPLPSSIRNPLFEGMDQTIWSHDGSARPMAIKSLLANPALMHDYLLLQHQMIGKTGTAEIMFNPNLYPTSPAQMYKHIWFGAIAFDPEVPAKVRWESPELVVVVFLRFGDTGKEAAPIAARMIRKWREIRGSRSYTQTTSKVGF